MCKDARGDFRSVTLAVALVLAASCGGQQETTVLVCPQSEMQCNDVCAPLDRDPKNCGACGITCSSGEVCDSGQCQTACPNGEAICQDSSGPFCTKLATDEHNCGACGTACESGQLCSAGQCSPSCSPGLTACGSACVDTTSDPSNCGVCGNQCVDHCTGGACVAATGIAVGASTSCALIADGDVVCWGGNAFGALGVGDPNQSDRTSTPVRVSAAYGTSIAGSYDTFCVTQVNQKFANYMSCWGNNSYGQLGSQASGFSPLLQPINGGKAPLGTGYTTCSSSWSDGILRCWGYNFYGQVGNPSVQVAMTDSPAQVQGPIYPAAVAVGQSHVCAVTQQHVYCWGSNISGELGLGVADFNAHASPTLVLGVSNAIGVAAGVGFSCALLSDGTVDCWGSMKFDGSDAVLTPTPVPNVASVSAIAGGGAHVCALIADGTVTCWGDTAGVSYDVSTLTGVAHIAAGTQHDCAVKTDGSVWCWGTNFVGELGDGTTTASPTPVKVK